MMNATPIHDQQEAVKATLVAKISVARLRSVHGATKAIRTEQAEALARYEAQLRAL